MMDQPKVKALVLDAGPLLSLSPLRGLSGSYYTVPQVLGELKDDKARTHFQNLGLSAGIKVEVRVPDTASVAKVTLAAKKSGDFAVLSVADIHVIALTYALYQEHLSQKGKDEEISTKETTGTEMDSSNQGESEENVPNDTSPLADQVQDPAQEEGNERDIDELAEELERMPLESTDSPPSAPKSSEPPSEEPLYNDPSSEDDGEGDWITPSNVALHKSRALDLLPDSANSKSKRRKDVDEKVEVACMSADYAVQNVLMHMGLNLVGVEGTRIKSVKSWVLRCHACFKICKDSSKKFCPNCGNASLLRTSISTTVSSDPSKPPKVEIHLKSNFQYRTRGTKYSIPLPKPGTSKTGAGTGLILREDQREYAQAVEKEHKREQREHEKLMKAAMNEGEGSVKVGDWNDPDWLPGMLGGEGKRRDNGGIPTIGTGRKNPNERKRRK